ncbi:hypothetical protein [Bosea sp. 685]|uniref:hypothetical protein n=1 Tax=Bosea sp. 685 TaxID=3080057 RepID=UPI00289357F6|nr:hypothetical protein [Bosea sp. 685]WNJ88397.1 hypothetical protein RMR04_18485 [Bosea sp. 685]
MSAITLLLPFGGALVGALGFYTDVAWVFWIGVALCGLNEFLNAASGVYRFPFIALSCVVVGILATSPWFVGAGLGLLAAGALDGASELFGRSH